MKTRNTLFLIILIGFMNSCASTIQSTGMYSNDLKIRYFEIRCITPTRLYKFSNNLCNNLKSNIENHDLTVTVNLKDEMTPTLNDSKPTSSSNDKLILEITHQRVHLYNGKPTSTLMNISARISTSENPFWAAKIHTSGNSLTGPGNPEKVVIEIINQMRKDGFEF